MRKTVIALVLVLLGMGAQAQIVSSRSSFETIERIEKEHFPIKTKWYVRLGLNMMKTNWRHTQFYCDYNGVEGNKTKPGFNLGFGFNAHFCPSQPSDFYWGAELGLTQVGGGYDRVQTYNNSYGFNYPSFSYNLLSAYIGPTIGWEKNLSSNIQLDLHFSPEALFCFGNKSVPHTTSTGSGRDNLRKETANLALRGGVGVWINRFNIDLSYRGTIKINDQYNAYSNIMLSVGFRL